MQPIYYLPGIFRDQLLVGGDLSRTVLRERGLDVVFADVGVASGEFLVSNVERGGPDGKSGCILCYATPDGKLPQISGYYPDQQTWHPTEEGLYWIGLAQAHPVTPADLRRRKRYTGYIVEIDGHKWEVPIVRRVDGSTELPRDCYFERGQFVEPIKAAYRRYWEDSKEVADWFFAERWSDFTKERGLTLAVQAFSLNYRFGMAEQNLLHAIDMESLLWVLSATVDVQGARQLEAAQKKTSSPSDSASTTPGQQDA